MRFVRPVAPRIELRARIPHLDLGLAILALLCCTHAGPSLERRVPLPLEKFQGHSHWVQEPAPCVIDVFVRELGHARDPDDPARPWRGEGPYRIVGRELVWRFDDVRYHDFGELRAAVAARTLGLHETPRVRFDGAATVADVLPVLDLLTDLGEDEVGFERYRR